MKKFKSKLIAIGTVLAASAAIASPILFTASCVGKNNKTNIDDNTSNEDNNTSNDGSNDNSSSDSPSTDDSNNSGSNSSDSNNTSKPDDSSTDNIDKPTTNQAFIYDKVNKSAAVNATSLGLSSNIFNVYQELFIDNKSVASNTNDVVSKLASISGGYFKTTDSINFSAYKLNIGSASSSTWTIELPVTTSSNALTSIYITFDNLYSNINNLLGSSSIVVNSGDYFPYTNLATIKSLSPNSVIKMLNSPASANVAAISNNFSFIPLEGSKNITTDNILCLDYSDSSGKSIEYLINNNGKLGLLVIKNSVTTLPKTSLITSTFGNDNKVSLDTFVNLTNNFKSLNFHSFSSSNSSLIVDQATVTKDTNLSALFNNYLTFDSNGINYQTGFGLDLAHYLNEYFTNLKSKWVSDSLLTDENISFYNNLKLTSSNNKKITGAIGFELRNPTSEIVSFNLPINNTEFLLSPSSIATVVINFNDSTVSPYLIEDSSASNSAYLSSSFTNVTMNTSETTFTTNNLSSSISYSNTKEQTYNFGSTSKNITPNSYALKTKISNVSFGNSALSSTSTINNAFNTYSYDISSTLRYATDKQLNDTYNKTLEAVKSVQSIILKMSTNPTVYDFVQNISSEIKDLFTLFSSDDYLPTIVSNLFSKDSVSTYLANNISNITKYLIANNKNNSSIVKTVVEILKLIVNSNPTQQNFHDLLKELDSYLPLLKTYLPSDAQFIIPLIEKIVPSLKEDKSILDITFENLDYILNFAISSSNNLFINSAVVNVLNSIKSYLSQLLAYSKYTGSSTNVNKYKTIKVFSVVTNELFATDASKTLLNLIASFLNLNPNSSSNLSNVLSSVSSLLNKNLKFKEEIEDYSELTFNNRGFGGLDLKFEWKYSGKPKKVSIETQLGKIFSSLVNVKIGNKTSDLYTALKTNVKKEVLEDTFHYWSINKTIDQDYTAKYYFKEDVTIDTLPICVLLTNLKDTTKLGLTSGMVSQINMGVNVYISKILAGRSIPHSEGAGFNITNGKGLGWLFPTDIVIKSKVNYMTISYKAKDAKVYPTVNKYDGSINFSWNTTKNIGIEASSVWNDSNSAFKAKGIGKAAWYGSAFGILTQNLNNLANILGIQFTTIPFKKVIGGLLNFDGGITSYSTVTTKLKNPYKISNYDATIANSDYYITQLKSASDIKSFLKNVVTTYGKWTTSKRTKKPEFSISLPSTFKTDLAKYFNISSKFTSDTAYYSYGFSGFYYKVPFDGNINNKKSTYQYTFTFKFSIPTILTTYKENNIPQTTKLVKSVSYSFVLEA